jgi:hypothetical protein
MTSKYKKSKPHEIVPPNDGNYVKVSVNNKEIILDNANYENPELKSKKNLVFYIHIGNHNIGNGNYCVATKEGLRTDTEVWRSNNWVKFDGVPSELFYMIVNEVIKQQKENPILQKPKLRVRNPLTQGQVVNPPENPSLKL